MARSSIRELARRRIDSLAKAAMRSVGVGFANVPFEKLHLATARDMIAAHFAARVPTFLQEHHHSLKHEIWLDWIKESPLSWPELHKRMLGTSLLYAPLSPLTHGCEIATVLLQKLFQAPADQTSHHFGLMAPVLWALTGSLPRFFLRQNERYWLITVLSFFEACADSGHGLMGGANTAAAGALCVSARLAKVFPILVEAAAADQDWANALEANALLNRAENFAEFLSILE